MNHKCIYLCGVLVLLHKMLNSPWQFFVKITIDTIIKQTLARDPFRGVLYVPRLNFKPLHVAVSEGSHVAVGISSKATDINIQNV